ncbi:hypothetical protein DNTS_007614 [Danionella cerebrum]|uniref:B30.2/SPRY domain-containing protein n=1 Tax=Danionella cerebrum TaxID=2873325 RepID=A0A553MZK5_9TELE|nr:hypothetical protein DNTS_007614 [Danionella translucida]
MPPKGTDQELCCPVCGQEHLSPESLPRNIKLKQIVEDYKANIKNGEGLSGADEINKEKTTNLKNSNDTNSVYKEERSQVETEVNEKSSRLDSVITSLREKLLLIDELVNKEKDREAAIKGSHVDLRKDVNSVMDEMEELIKAHRSTGMKLLEAELKQREDAAEKRLKVLSDAQKFLRTAELQVQSLLNETEDLSFSERVQEVEDQVSKVTIQDSLTDMELPGHLKEVCEKIEHQNNQLRLGLGSAQRALRVVLNPSEVTFDPETIHPNLVLSEDLKSLSFSVTKQQYPATPLRFTSFFQALSSQSFTQGEHLWHFQAEACSWVFAVCYSDLPRSGSASGLESSLGSWCLMYCDNLLRAYEQGKDMHLRRTPSLKKMEIRLSFSSGSLVFYSVSDVSREKTLLHTFNVNFTLPVFLAVRMMSGQPKAHISLN